MCLNIRGMTSIYLIQKVSIGAIIITHSKSQKEMTLISKVATPSGLAQLGFGVLTSLQNKMETPILMRKKSKK
jgi:hypothetical protein